MNCPNCSVEHTEEALVCEICGALLWKKQLEACFAQSRKAEAEKDWDACLKSLTRCLKLLPEGTRQHRQILNEIRRVSNIYSSQPPMPNPESLEAPDVKRFKSGTWGGVLSGAFRSTLRGLSRPRTLISLAVWTVALSFLLGWQTALAFGLVIYVHEMGHLIAIQYFGYRFAWPMFIPFLGAFVLQGKQSESRFENVTISMSGPLAGVLLSFSILALGFRFELPEPVNKIAYIGLLINFLNLMPVWMLDGARIARHLSRHQLVFVILPLFVVTVVNLNGFAFVMAVAWTIQTFIQWGDAATRKRGERWMTLTVCILIVMLASSSVVLKLAKSAG